MRCTPVSAGCENCWHQPFAKRFAANPSFSDEVRAAYAGDSSPVLVESRLADPIKRRKPAVIGVEFMGDLMHEDVPFDFIDRVVAVMARTQQHRYIILTKRAERMHDYFTGLRDDPEQAWRFDKQENAWPSDLHGVALSLRNGGSLPNVMGMVTVENQPMADERIPWLLKTPFAMRGISVEPMLSSIDTGGGSHGGRYRMTRRPCPVCKAEDILGEKRGTQSHPINCGWRKDQGNNVDGGIDWIICGSESGPGARPMQIEWARSLKDQCNKAGVPFFFKQAMVDGKLSHSPKLDGQEYKEIPTGMEIGNE